MDGRRDLVRRIAQLDGDEGNLHAEVTAHPDLARFVAVMEQITSIGAIRDVHQMPCLAAADADALVGSCRLLARLSAIAPEIVTGPMNIGAQYWVATGNPDHLPRGERELGERHFIGVADMVNL